MQKRLTLQLFLLAGIATAQVPQKKAPKPVQLTKEVAGQMKDAAADYYKNENYKRALELYKQLQAFDPDNMDFNYKLGMCYLNTDVDKGAAANYLVKASTKKDAPKDLNFYLGNALRYLNELDDAIDTYEKYKEVNNGKLNPKFNVDNNIEWCYHAKELIKTPVAVKFVNAGKQVNANTADFRPVTDADGSLLFFTSNRKGNTGAIVDGTGEFTSDVYYTTFDTAFAKAKNPGPNINSMAYEEALHLNVNADRLLLYREGGDAVSPLYVAAGNGKSWEKATPITKIPIGDALQGACMTSNGKTIYFAAEMKGGKGGKDIWSITQDEKGEWGDPKNLGDAVNTKFDEINPYLFFDDQTLFFASQGHNSMGGFDIFKTDRFDAAMAWSKPANVGYPLNTAFDDKFFCLLADGKTGYVSAHKKDGIGETDIYKFYLLQSLIANKAVLFKAYLQKTDGTVAKDALCTIVRNDTGESMGLYKANSLNGKVTALLPAGHYKMKVKGVKSGRLDVDFTITGSEKNMRFEKIFKLAPPLKD